MTRRKPRRKSWTLWINGLALVLAAAEAKLSVLQPALRADVYAWVAFILPIVNMLLRLKTNSAVGGVPPS